MIKRVSRSLSDVAKEILEKLKNEHGVTDKQLAQLRSRVLNSGHTFPIGGIRVSIKVLWIDYEVQRDVIIKHILNLLKKWDCRICQPAACNTVPELVEVIDAARDLYRFKQLFVYDAQHRCVTLAVLGFKEIPVTVVIDSDPKFASYAFREANNSIKKIGLPDMHRNNLRLYGLDVHDEETIRAKHLQDQFDRLNINLCEDSVRCRLSAEDRSPWYMSHFDYAIKPMGADKSGKTAYNILKAIVTTWPRNQKIQNGIYVGLHHMNEKVKSLGVKLPADWMTQVCKMVATSFPNSEDVETSAERHAKGIAKSKTWAVPESMYKFMREVYKLNGGRLVIPGDGADYELHKGFWIDANLVPNHKHLFRVRRESRVEEMDYA